MIRVYFLEVGHEFMACDSLEELHESLDQLLDRDDFSVAMTLSWQWVSKEVFDSWEPFEGWEGV